MAASRSRPSLTCCAACSQCMLLLAVVLLVGGATLPTVAGERHDTAPAMHKILTVIPIGGSSHSFDLLAVAAVLANRHSVTVVTPTQDLGHTMSAVKRLGAMAGPMTFQPMDDLMGLTEFHQHGRNIGKGSFYNVVSTFANVPKAMATKCERLVANETLMQEWRSYDMLLTFNFPPPGDDSCPCLLSHVLDIPLMCVNDMTLYDIPFHLPQFGSGLTKAQVQGSTLMALLNACHWLKMQALILVLNAAEAWSMRGLRGKLGLPLTGGPAGRTCVPVVDARSVNWLLEEPQLMGPNQVVVGAISPHPSHATIADPAVSALAAAANRSGHGLVLVSFGSTATMFSGSLNLEDYTALALAFADLSPVKVLWLLPPKALPEGVNVGALPTGPNTLVVPWASVNDVLGHPACRAFVTHGGQKSVYEAMFHGVPIVGVPFMSEQLHNTQRCAARGLGVVSPEAPALRTDGQRYTREGVVSLVRQVLAPSYAAAAHQIGEAMRLAYSHKRPVDRAAEEVELAMIHGGYSIQHSLARAKLREAKHTGHPVSPPQDEQVAGGSSKDRGAGGGQEQQEQQQQQGEPYDAVYGDNGGREEPGQEL